LDRLSILPDAPPAAGPDRALDPLPADPVPLAAVLPDASCPADAEGEVARPTGNPISGNISAVTAIHLPPLFDSNRRTPGGRACLAAVSEVDRSGEEADEGGGAASELPATTAGLDIAVESGWSGSILGIVGS